MLNSACVYVVDDDQAVRDSLQWLLESAGLLVKTYETAGAFLEKAGKELLSCIGCVVAEARLPVISGIDLQSRLQLLGIAIPVLMVTGYGEVAEAVAAMKAGAVDYIEKPFADRVLVDQVCNVLQSEQRRQETGSQAHRGSRSQVSVRLLGAAPFVREAARPGDRSVALHV